MKAQENIYLNQDNDQTRIADNTIPAADTSDNTVLNNELNGEYNDQDEATVAAEDSQSAEAPRDKKLGTGTKVAMAAGGVAVVGGVVAATAMASDSETPTSTLAQAATPDQELPADQLSDSLASRVDPGQAPEPILHDTTVVTEEIAIPSDNNTTTTTHPLEGAVLADANPHGDARFDDNAITGETAAANTVANDSIANGAAAHGVNININIDGQNVSVESQTAQNVQPEPTNVEPAQTGTIDPAAVIIETPGGVRVAHVDDEVSFEAAFAQAREQVGPGGIFEYHGATYGTYYANEWDELSNEERAQFQANAQLDEVAKEPEIDVNVTSVGSHMMADGSVVNLATVDVDGEQVVMLDVDNDGVVDGAVADFNHDGVLDETEVVDLSDTHLTMEELAENMIGDTSNDIAFNDGMDLPDFDANCDL